ncbi:cardiolipin synthase, partial [Bacillus toyonensis]
MLSKKAKTIVIAIPLAAVIGFGGYSAYNSHFSNIAGEDKNAETVILSKDFPATSDLNQMINEADLVVIGEYGGLDSKWNMARNPNNPSEEDKENYVEGHLYNFNISETIKGVNENKQIKINHRFAETVKLEDSNAVVAPDGTVTKQATKVTTKEVQNKDPLYIEPKVNKKYMMFLKKDQLFGNYYGAIEP